MATCGRCGRQTESARDACPHCSEYGEPQPALDSRADPDQVEPVETEFPSLPHFERPFAAERTVWPDAPELVPSLVSATPPAEDLASRPPEQEIEPPAIRGGGRWIALTAAMAVLLLATAGAVTVVLRQDQTSQNARAFKPSVFARPLATAATAAAPPTGTTQLTVDPPVATAPGEPAIVVSLTRYFDAINSRDYLLYRRQFILPLRGGISPASFSAAFGTTTDSGERLRSISAGPGGEADGFVTFVSQQPTPSNPGSVTCTAWGMEFYLGRRGNRYLLVAPPVWYPTWSASCP